MNYHFKTSKHLHVGTHDLNIDIQCNQKQLGKPNKKIRNLSIFDQKVKFTEHINSTVNIKGKKKCRAKPLISWKKTCF